MVRLAVEGSRRRSHMAKLCQRADRPKVGAGTMLPACHDLRTRRRAARRPREASFPMAMQSSRRRAGLSRLVLSASEARRWRGARIGAEAGASLRVVCAPCCSSRGVTWPDHYGAYRPSVKGLVAVTVSLPLRAKLPFAVSCSGLLELRSCLPAAVSLRASLSESLRVARARPAPTSTGPGRPSLSLRM